MKRLAQPMDVHLARAAEEVQRAARHRRWTWCRRQNGFSDLPVWRLVAERLGMKLPYVVAFAHRLEEHANGAEPRGSVEGFSASEFAIALGMTAEDAARIFAELEHPDVGWIAYGHVATFYERNPDKEDHGAAERKRLQRARARAMKEIARQAHLGLISAEQRTVMEARVLLGDTDVPVPRLSTVQVSQRDAESVTPRADHTFKPGAVDNFGAATRGEGAGPSDEDAARVSGNPQDEAAAWLLSTGVKIVAQRMDDPTPKAATRVERWLNQNLNGDAVGLREIIESVAAGDTTVARFLVLVTDGIERWKRRPQPQLALLPPRPGRRTGTGDA